MHPTHVTRRTLIAAFALVVTACAPGDSEPIVLPDDPDAPILQVREEGGLLPVEYLLALGPRYTLLADGRLIHTGVSVGAYPGPLVPGYVVTSLDAETMNSILELVAEIGLPRIDFEYDDSAASRVMDAGNTVIVYWDQQGEHVYSVYGLGLGDFSSRKSTKAAEELRTLLDRRSVEGPSQPYQPVRVRVLVGTGVLDPELDDVRDWPLSDTDLSTWTPVDTPFGEPWACRVYGPEIINVFADATQATRWRSPAGEGGTYTLLVRPLHPGEPDCPGF